MAKDFELDIHKRWLGFLQPVGLVVSPPALAKCQVIPNKNVAEIQQDLQGMITQSDFGDDDVSIEDFPKFATQILGWEAGDIAGAPGGPSLPDALEYNLVDYGEVLTPDYAVLDQRSKDKNWLMLVKMVETGTSLDEHQTEAKTTHWTASPQAKFERLLRETGVYTGLLCNGTQLRLVYAPKGETSGHITFPFQAMCEVAGREILGAMHMLLEEYRVFSAPDGQRLDSLLVESRKYQNEVSVKLAEQVLGALWELLRGFQSADEATKGRLLGEISREHPEHIYGGLLTTLLRLVFILYAEEQDLLTSSPIYWSNYSISGLYARLREDAGRYPDTMDQRYGAWSWLLSLFRLLFDGGGHGDLHFPTRHGQLFNPDEYPFLEGRPMGVMRVMDEKIDPPRVSDGCIYRVLEGLLVLDGERLSYRALDVEQIGSVYEAMMGFEVERAFGFSIGVKSSNHKPGAVRADTVVNLEELLAVDGGKRSKWLKEQANCDVSGKATTALKKAESLGDLVAALERRLSQYTQSMIPPGSLYLQPGEERRRSGSHYTPRELTEPIVRTTLEPVFDNLGPKPKPEKILDLKVCDPAMGSGAFLVEACRQLAEKLVEAWEIHRCTPELPPDEDSLLHARRLVAEHCLYGVDKNPFAVNLAKLSLWLVTLAREHPFTFVDHSLKHGDSLVGLSQEQIAAFNWNVPDELDSGPMFEGVLRSIDSATAHRHELRKMGEDDYVNKRHALNKSENSIYETKLVADVIVAAFFLGLNSKERNTTLKLFENKTQQWKSRKISTTEFQSMANELRSGMHPIFPFHWEVEFPEVFSVGKQGFDIIIGNPPFAGKNNLINSNRDGFLHWLQHIHKQSNGNSDIVAHFFRRSFNLLRKNGAMGLIATNTIGQGDTRFTGLKWICQHGGDIYNCNTRHIWPGAAAVIVSVVHIFKGEWVKPRNLDSREVDKITAFLFHKGNSDDPHRLLANKGISFQGSNILGKGFIFNDRDKTGAASSLQEMRNIIDKDPRNKQRIFPYIGGSEVNNHPTHCNHRYVINFGELDETKAKDWPDLYSIIEQKVKPERLKQKREIRKRYWWRFGESTPALYRSIDGLNRIIVCVQTSKYRTFTFLPNEMVYDQKLVVFAFSTTTALGILHSRVHEIWALFMGSSMRDDPVYTPTDCFETFPFPSNWDTMEDLQQIGNELFEYRKDFMIACEAGLTDTYNRFHNPTETDTKITKLRELHDRLDRLVLDAYGWTDVGNRCEFILEYDVEGGLKENKMKPYRYRWPNETRDEVLARLLDLNQTRAQAERLAGASQKKKKQSSQLRKKSPRRKKKKATKDESSIGMDAILNHQPESPAKRKDES
jgi:hypothetical protein